MGEHSAKSKTSRIINLILRYTILILVGFIMIYPLLWMIGATFKSNAEIFSTVGLFTSNPTLQGYKDAMTNYGGTINIWTAMLHTYEYVIPKVVFTLISATITAYGFGRFEFKGKGFLFAVLMSTLFLPQVVLNVPQYILFNKLGWVDSPIYLAIIVPTLFATDTYFVFMLIQFLHNVPKELEEAAMVDGAGPWYILLKIVVPLSKPVLATIALFTIVGQWNEFFQGLVLSTGERFYPLQTYIKQLIFQLDTSQMTADQIKQASMMSNTTLNAAKIFISMVPVLCIYPFLQKYFVTGITLGGVKE